MYTFKVYNLSLGPCLHLWNYHHNKDDECMHCPKVSLGPFVISLPQPQATTLVLSVTIDQFAYSNTLHKQNHISIYSLSAFFHSA